MSKKKIQKTRVDGVTQGYHVGSRAEMVPTSGPTVPTRDVGNMSRLRSDMAAAMLHPGLRSEHFGTLIEAIAAVDSARRAYVSARLEETVQRYNAIATQRGIAPVTEQEKQAILTVSDLLYADDPRSTPKAVDGTYSQAVLFVMVGSKGRFHQRGFRRAIADWLLKSLEPKITSLSIAAAYEQERLEKARAAEAADYQAIRDFNARYRSGTGSR